MCISVVTRALKTSELLPLVLYLGSEKDIEIVAVCRDEDDKLPSYVNLVLEGSGMLRARVTGAKASHCDSVLFLDSDQLPEPGLFDNLRSLEADMVVIPERSLTGGLSGVLLDDWRKRLEAWAASQSRPSPAIPVIPRFFRRAQLLRVIEHMPAPVIDNIVLHEDSVLYAAVATFTDSLAFSHKVIFNIDPPILTVLRKAFSYGYYDENAHTALEHMKDAYPYLELTRALDLASLKFREIGLGPGYILQSLRALAYILGIITARFKS
jgi:hypothetical protein